MKIVKGLVANSISGSTRFTHDDASLIAVTGAVVFGKHPNQHAMPSNEVFFHVAGIPGDGATIASVGGDFVVSGSTNLLDNVFVPDGTVHIGESPEQMRLSILDGTGSILTDAELNLSGTTIGVDASSGRIQFKRDDADYLFFDLLPGENHIRVESQEKIFLRATEIVNNSVDGEVTFQKDGVDRLLIDMNNDPNELTIESDGGLRLMGSALILEGDTTIEGSEDDELTIRLESTFKEIVTFEKNVFLNGGVSFLNDLVTIDENEFVVNVPARFSTDVTLGTVPDDELIVNATAGFLSDVSIDGNVRIEGNVTVIGDTTALNVQNLVVQDPFILLASGSTGYNVSGGIVILNGASENEDLVDKSDLAFGRVANDTWGVVRVDAMSGMLEDLNGGSLVAFRASEIQVGGSNNYVTILSDTDLHVHAASNLLLDVGDDKKLILQADGDDWLTFDTQTNSILPGTDNAINLGSNSRRFANVYTGDLHLRNDRGHWQIVEEADCLTIYNRLTNVRYRFVLERYDA